MLTSCAWLKSFSVCGLNSLFNDVNWNTLPAICKCKASYSLSSTDRSESDSCSGCKCVKYFSIFLKSFVGFVILFTWLDQDELDAPFASFSASGHLVSGCPFFLKLKHYLSFQYYLSKGLLPLQTLLPLSLPPLWPLPPCTNVVPSDCVILCTTVLMYLLSRCRVC